MISEWNRKASQVLFGNRLPENLAKSSETWQRNISTTKAFMAGYAAGEKAMRNKYVKA